MDCEEGTSVTLGFGLLLRECERAKEVEGDDENYPEFLQQSLLGDKRARLIVKAIGKVIGRLPSPDTEEERPKEKELDGGAKAQKGKARAGQKKLAATPSLAPSTSKPSGTQKDDKSPAGTARSQRQRKPSKKLRDSN
ncbi:hypothetical protein F5888DRAFT_1807024 [Russula emetica]|nr:hypothetical protein F5888DRAFT_1807024 [Russula emetica]